MLKMALLVLLVFSAAGLLLVWIVRRFAAWVRELRTQEKRLDAFALQQAPIAE